MKICEDSNQKSLSIIYKIVLKQISIPMHGKSLTLSQSTRKEMRKLLAITDQSHFFQFLVKFLKKSYLISFLNTFKTIVFFVITNQVFVLLIHVSIMWVLSVLHDIYASFDCNPFKDVRGIFLHISNVLIEYGMKGSSIKCNVLV